jgi:Mg2+-importing ATPase
VGLTSAEARERLARFGPNLLEADARGGAARLLLRQFESPLVLILVFGAAVSLATRSWTDAAIILAIVVGSALLGFSQEYRAHEAIARLRQRLALTTRVVRDGVTLTIPAAEVVPGDAVLLAAGNLVPADGTILEARDFLVSEASLTGESFPVEKEAGGVAFMGTSVRSGTAAIEVTATGRATAYGAIAARLRTSAPETDFARGVRQFGYLLMRVMIVTVVLVLVANQWLGRPAMESLLFAVALAVGLTPELLPAIVTVTLARGAHDMAEQGVVVRRLEAIENLGTMDVLCTDKTGTLTQGTVALEAATDERGESSQEVLRLGYLNAAFETGIDNPLDAALVAAGEAKRMTPQGYRKVDEIPYDFLRRRLTIVMAPEATPGEHLVVTKGAVPNVIAACAIDAGLAARAEAYVAAQCAEGFRVLAVATKRVPARERYGRDDEAGMTLAGFLLFLDPVKTQAAETIRNLAVLGIRVKMITGDNRHVAAHVGAAVGLDPARLITGEEIAAMKDEALWHRVQRTQILAEIDPQQKERIVRALQHRGHAVGFLGDGINDVPALHAADVGISVDQAVDVARETAHVVMLRPDLEVLRRGVLSGRRAFANTLKYIGITASANFGNMMSMALVTPLMPFLPLAAKQILFNNFLSDLPMVAVSTDNVDQQSLTHAQRWDAKRIRTFMILFGLVSSVFDLVTFLVLLQVFDAPEPEFQTAWFVVSVLTELAVILVLRTHLATWRSRPGAVLLWTTLAIAALSLALPYLGPVARVFGFVPLPAALMACVVGIVVGYVATTEAAKRFLWKGW